MEGPLYLAIFYIIVHYTVGWSDFVLFCIFKIGHIAVDQIYI